MKIRELFVEAIQKSGQSRSSDSMFCQLFQGTPISQVPYQILILLSEVLADLSPRAKVIGHQSFLKGNV
jgi:hypothetical protein